MPLVAVRNDDRVCRATRDHAIQRHTECYGNLPSCRRCHLLPSSFLPFPPPRGLSRVHCPVHWPRAARLIEIRCRDSSWRNLLLENVSSARISRLLIFNKAESSESSKSEESDFNARLLWPIRVETIEGEKRLPRRVSGGEGGEFE